MYLKWKEDVDRNIRLPNGQYLPVVLMVNKADSAKDNVDKMKFDRWAYNLCRSKLNILFDFHFIIYWDVNTKFWLFESILLSIRLLVIEIMWHSRALNNDIFQTTWHTYVEC